MKQFIIFLFLIASFVTFAANPQLMGKWEDKKNQISYEFKHNGTIVFEQMGYPVFVKTYTLDETRNPQLLIMTLKQGHVELQIPALLAFIGPDSLQIEQFSPYQKPVDFSKGGDMKTIHFLKKIKLD